MINKLLKNMKSRLSLLESKPKSTIVTAKIQELTIAIIGVQDVIIGKECDHPFAKLHWVGDTVFCNKCNKNISN